MQHRRKTEMETPGHLITELSYCIAHNFSIRNGKECWPFLNTKHLNLNIKHLNIKY